MGGKGLGWSEVGWFWTEGKEARERKRDRGRKQTDWKAKERD